MFLSIQYLRWNEEVDDMDSPLNFTHIGERIKNKRKELGLTQEKLADMAYIGVQHLSKIENGKAMFSLSCLVSLANALKITTDYLLMDSVIATRPHLMGEVKIFFDDCSHNELHIIMRMAKTLKECLRQTK
jgi:transcriptional regulator with XRE-family HTH domain